MGQRCVNAINIETGHCVGQLTVVLYVVVVVVVCVCFVFEATTLLNWANGEAN